MVPMLRGDTALSLIAVKRQEPTPFTDQQVALLQTFADQGVIAIENVRLFKELEARNREVTEALDQKTATSEILRVIASSPTDLQPVFDTIADRAMRLCDAAFGAVHMFDGALIHFNAVANWNAEGADALRRAFPRPATRTSTSGRVILTAHVVEIPDVLADPEYQLTDVAQVARYRSSLGVPMLHQGRVIGVITVTRSEPGTFPQEQVQLLQTFADQAVIAIENVRLFTELQDKNRALTRAHAQVTEALEQQTATSEILRVIASSPTDVQPVFDTITQNALELCGAASSLLTTFDGELLHLAALANLRPGVADSLRRVSPMRPGRGAAGARAILTRAVVHIPDLREDPEYALRDLVQALDFRSVLAVPMLREGKPIGTINVHKGDPEPFSESQIALLQTFAAQAVIAIENVRLFTELQQKNGALTQAHAQVSEALEQQTATAEILRVISSSPTDV